MTPSKCNLFSTISNQTGNFLTFSQYAEDLTRQYTQPMSYKVVPSKYCAMDITLPEKSTAESVAMIFQNYFENSCTLHRAAYSGENGWNSNWSTSLFWRTLVQFGLVTRSKEYTQTYEQIKNIGDINIWSHNDSDNSGVGYSEIYCLIDNAAKHEAYNISQYNVSYGSNNELPPAVYSSTQYISGFNDKSITPTPVDLEKDGKLYYDEYKTVDDGVEAGYYYKMGTSYIPVILHPEGETGTTTTTETNSENFTFNTIAIFYDIIGEDGESLMKNIPLGIYFLGGIDDKGNMTNSFTKYTSNQDIYGEGTSYALRICSRFVTSYNSSDFGKVDTETTHDIYYGGISKILSEFAETTTLINEVTKSNSVLLEQIQDANADYRNNRLNVPYVKMVDNEFYWFVNGVNTGVQASGSGSGGSDGGLLKATQNGWVIYGDRNSTTPVVTYDKDSGVIFESNTNVFIGGSNIMNMLLEIKDEIKLIKESLNIYPYNT